MEMLWLTIPISFDFKTDNKQTFHVWGKRFVWFQGHPPLPDPTSYSQVQQALQDKVGACLEWESAREVVLPTDPTK